MKRLFSAALFVFISSLRLQAQDCTSAEDCLKQAMASRGTQQTLDFYEKALKLAKKENYNPSKIYLTRGLYYFHVNVGHFKEAEKDFRNALKEDPKNVDAQLSLAELIGYGEEDYKDGLKYFTEAVAKFPNNPKVFYKRAQHHRNHKFPDLSAVDFEMAYNLMLDDASMLDEDTRAEITRWHNEMYMRSNKIILGNANTVKILEAGYKLAPNNARLIGDLVLAYYDTDQIQKAEELAPKANEISKSNTGGSLVIAMQSLENKDYSKAANLMGESDRSLLHAHPLVYYFFAQAVWAHCFNVAKNQWVNNKAMIRNRLELAIQYGEGTKYDNYAKHAKQLLATIDN